MKKYCLYSIMFLIILTFIGCQKTNQYENNDKVVETFVTSTADNANPENLYKQNPEIDMFVYNGVAYVNATNVEWVMALNITKSELLGTIIETNATKDFKTFSSTTLDVGTEIYTTNSKHQIFLVKVNEGLIPYLAWIEG